VSSPSGPVRTCLGCRRRSGKDGLVRVVLEGGGRVRIDPTRTAPGRGAYVHPEPSCLGALGRRGLLARALRASLGEAEVSRLMDEMTSTLGDER